ncbi:MAG: adenylate/guanylate cyclase domain-containing protein [Synoicihabitans sp.]
MLANESAQVSLVRLRHELRTPLNQIVGYSELLIETVDEHGIDNVISWLEEVNEAGNEMLAKLNEEFASRKMQSGQVNLARLKSQMLSPLRLIDDACSRCGTLAGEQGSVAVVDDLGKIGAAVHSLRSALDVTAWEEVKEGDNNSAFPLTESNPPVVDSTKETGKLLVVDDDRLNREMIKRRLRHMGFEIVLAADGLDALTALAREKFDLVLLDVLMPELDGFGTLERIRNHPDWSKIPVVMLSALDDADTTARCISAGAEDYVPKPFNSVVLRARISASLEKKRLRDKEALYLEQIQEEREKSEQLLLSILPSAIADRLKSGERDIVDEVPAATVMFIDIVGFTSIAARTQPDTTVHLLNSLFSSFDAVTDAHGMEKIKTIGDAYMAVAGVPNAADDHAQRAARMALAIQNAVRKFNRRHGVEWSVRIGLHSGPVMAGIIGSRKFAYDLWGDTVNIASRLESQGVANGIQLSAETADLIKDEFSVSAVGVLNLRNRGEMPVFRLEGGKTAAAE